jgi:hypothetical protein
MVHSTNLATLRRRRLYIHRQLDRYEPLVARLRESLAECEAAMQAIDPRLFLPPRRYAANPYFARGELPRLALRIMREAGKPVSVREIALAALASKGVRYPDRRRSNSPARGSRRRWPSGDGAVRGYGEGGEAGVGSLRGCLETHAA